MKLPIWGFFPEIEIHEIASDVTAVTAAQYTMSTVIWGKFEPQYCTNRWQSSCNAVYHSHDITTSLRDFAAKRMHNFEKLGKFCNYIFIAILAPSLNFNKPSGKSANIA